MTSFSEGGSSRHDQTGSGDVMDSEIGDSAMSERAAGVVIDRRAVHVRFHTRKGASRGSHNPSLARTL